MTSHQLPCRINFVCDLISGIDWLKCIVESTTSFCYPLQGQYRHRHQARSIGKEIMMLPVYIQRKSYCTVCFCWEVGRGLIKKPDYLVSLIVQVVVVATERLIASEWCRPEITISRPADCQPIPRLSSLSLAVCCNCVGQELDQPPC